MLSEAKAHRERIKSLMLSNSGLKKSDWLAVVGVGSTTRVRMGWQKDRDFGEFLLSSGDRMNRWSEGATDEVRYLTGDGTVPLHGALPPFLDPSRVVCVTPDDYGYWELQDRATSAAAGFHGILPNMNMLHRMVVRHITGRKDRHNNTWGRRLPGVSNWQPPLELHEKT